jgi:hypothetical protein
MPPAPKPSAKAGAKPESTNARRSSAEVRESGRKVPMSAAFPPQLAESLPEIASEYGLTTSAFIVRVIAGAIETGTVNELIGAVDEEDLK